jgi:hypothetical protein
VWRPRCSSVARRRYQCCRKGESAACETEGPRPRTARPLGLSHRAAGSTRPIYETASSSVAPTAVAGAAPICRQTRNRPRWPLRPPPPRNVDTGRIVLAGGDAGRRASSGRGPGSRFRASAWEGSPMRSRRRGSRRWGPRRLRGARDGDVVGEAAEDWRQGARWGDREGGILSAGFLARAPIRLRNHSE